jgi:hypothetical protein
MDPAREFILGSPAEAGKDSVASIGIGDDEYHPAARQYVGASGTHHAV